MRKNRYNPYGIDFDYELRTHKNVGKDYGNYKTANLGKVKNLLRWYRKKKNKNEKSYKFCHTHSEWENHVRDILPKNIVNYQDLIYWLKHKKRNAEMFLKMVEIILIPLYIALLGVYNFMEQENVGTMCLWASFISSVFFILICSMIILVNMHSEVFFCTDLLEVLEINRGDEVQGECEVS